MVISQNPSESGLENGIGTFFALVKSKGLSFIFLASII